MTDAELTGRLIGLAKDFDISFSYSQLRSICDYYQLLRRWNPTINLTALPLDEAPDETLNRLIMEPACAAPLLQPREPNWFDLGSGGGSPAVPLKIMRPDARLTMVEANGRKSAFLREVIHRLTLSSTTVVSDRFEATAKGEQAGTASLITVRAVRPNEILLSAAAALLGPSGRLVFFTSPAASGQIRFTPRFRKTGEIDVPSLSARIVQLTKA